MLFVKNSRGGREVNMINTVSKVNLSKIGWEGGGSTSIWIMSLNILGVLQVTPKAQCAPHLLRVKLTPSKASAKAHTYAIIKPV